LEFLDFSRNRLAVHPLPPSETSAVLFLFWYEPPGGDEFLPGGATLLHLI